MSKLNYNVFALQQRIRSFTI